MTFEGNSPAPELIQDYIDGQLDAATRRQVETYLDEHPGARERVEAYRAQGAALHDLYDDVLGEEVPERLLAATRRWSGGASDAAPRGGGGGGSQWRWTHLATAAMMVGMLGFGVVSGWALRGNLVQHDALQAASNDFLHQAANAFSLYSTPGTPWSDNDTTDFAALLGWMQDTLRVDIAESALESAGYSFVSGRPLPLSSGLAGEVVFRDTDGRRLTLYFHLRGGPGEQASFAGPDHAPPGTYVRRDGLSIYYWQSEPVSIALMGPLEEDTLVELASSLFQRAAPDAPAPEMPASDTPTSDI